MFVISVEEELHTSFFLVLLAYDDFSVKTHTRFKNCFFSSKFGCMCLLGFQNHKEIGRTLSSVTVHYHAKCK